VHLLNGSGRVNLGQGAVQGVEAAGACVSPVPGGWLVHRYRYPVAFIALGSLSVVSIAIWIGYGPVMRGTLGKMVDVDPERDAGGRRSRHSRAA
jgi:hypothetical protein